MQIVKGLEAEMYEEQLTFLVQPREEQTEGAYNSSQGSIVSTRSTLW